MRINEISVSGQTIPLANMVVIVGSNSAGKTRLLEELNYAFTKRDNGITNFWNIKLKPEIKNEDCRKWFQHITFKREGQVKIYYSPYTYKNIESRADGLELHENAYDMYKEDLEKFLIDHPTELIKEHTQYLPVDRRIAVPYHQPISGLAEKPATILDVLFRNPQILSEINLELIRMFNKRIIISQYEVTYLRLLLVDNEIEPEPKVGDNPSKYYEDFNKWREKNNIEENVTIQGHGLLSFLYILLSYYVPLNHIILIDEPEMHLYPSIKRKFGSTIGELSKKKDKQFFCVTHDSDFLQGILDSKCETTILRIKKTSKKRELFVKSVTSNDGYFASQTQTPYLQIPFLDAAIIVEGVTDRFVYEYFFNEQNFLSDVEYKFISSGGKMGLNNPIRIANDLNVPYAVILDIDNLKNEQTKLHEIENVSGDKKLLEKIINIRSELKRIDSFKNKGIDAIEDVNLKERVIEIISELKPKGIFIVPKGEMESWGNTEIKKTSHFPEEVIEEYVAYKEKFKDIIGFLEEIATYIKIQL